jgi:ubiquinone/menaquinone biosynthesis C-methylase UbiE
MSLPGVDTSYEPYADDPIYVAVNQALVDTIDLQDVERVADLACGTGLLTGLLFERKPAVAVCDIDLDPQQIDIARRKLGARRRIVADLQEWRTNGVGAVHLRVGNAQQLPFADGEIDLVMIANAIHMMTERQAFLAEVRRVLGPRGAFVFNSAFFVGTLAPGTEPFYTEWLKQAVARLDEMNETRAKQGLPPITRRRGTTGRAFSKGWLSPEHWQDALEQAGFVVKRNFKRAMPISREGLKRVAAYGGMAEVLMSGYPLEVSSACLQAGADAAFAAFGMDEVSRYWLEITAVRG